MRVRRAQAVCAASVLVLLLACGEGGAPAADASGLATVFDSTGADTVVARTAGQVPADRVRGLTEELRIQPDAEDTSAFTQVFQFVVAKDGRMYVFDEGSTRLFVYGPDGALQRTVGRKGAGPGEFGQNNGMAVLPDGRLAVLDYQNARLSFFTAAGDTAGAWRVTSGFFSNDGLRSDTTGALLLARPVTEPRDGEILGRMGLVRLAEGGAFGDSLLPADLPVQRVAYVAEMNGGRSQYSAPHSGRLHSAWHPHGWFAVASGDRYVVELATPGRARRIVRDAPAVPVPEAERADAEARITASLRRNDPNWTFRGPPIPSTKAPVMGLRATRDGRLWVRVATPSEEIPEAERDPAVAGRPNPLRYRDANEWEVFEADGRFVGRVRIGARAALMEADGDTVWLLDRDADGLPGVVRARVTPGF